MANPLAQFQQKSIIDIVVTDKLNLAITNGTAWMNVVVRTNFNGMFVFEFTRIIEYWQASSEPKEHHTRIWEKKVVGFCESRYIGGFKTEHGYGIYFKYKLHIFSVLWYTHK